MDLKVANLVTDQELLVKVRHFVEGIFEEDPQLSSPENQILHQAFKSNQEGLSWNKIS